MVTVFLTETNTDQPAQDAQVTAINTSTGQSMSMTPCAPELACHFVGILPYTTNAALGQWELTATRGADGATATIAPIGSGSGTGPMPGPDALNITNDTLIPTITWTAPASVVDRTANDGNVDRFRIRMVNDVGERFLDAPLTGQPLSTSSYTLPIGILTEPGCYQARFLIEGFSPYVRSSTELPFSIADESCNSVPAP